MNKQLYGFEFILENCDSIRVYIDPSDPGYNLKIGNIRKELWIQDGDVSEISFADYAKFQFYYPQFHLTDGEELKPIEQEKLERRLRFGDITGVELLYSDDTNQIVYMPWKGNKQRNLALKISKYEDDYRNDIIFEFDGRNFLQKLFKI